MTPAERYSDIIDSHDILERYIRRKLPKYQIKPVPGNGKCIILAMQTCLENCGIVHDVDTIKNRLYAEISSRVEFYKGFCVEDNVKAVNIEEQLEKFFGDPLAYYGCEAGDFFLPALGNSCKVNIVVLMSNQRKAWSANLSNYPDGHTMYFARTLSEHIDPVVPRELNVKQEIVAQVFICPLCNK